MMASWSGRHIPVRRAVMTSLLGTQLRQGILMCGLRMWIRERPGVPRTVCLRMSWTVERKASYRRRHVELELRLDVQ